MKIQNMFPVIIIPLFMPHENILPTLTFALRTHTLNKVFLNLMSLLHTIQLPFQKEKPQNIAFKPILTNNDTMEANTADKIA